MPKHDEDSRCIWNRPEAMMVGVRYQCQCPLLRAIETLEKMRSAVAALNLALMSATAATTSLFKSLQEIADDIKDPVVRTKEGTATNQVPGL